VEVWYTFNLGPLRLGEEKRKKIETTEVKYNGLPITMGGHKKSQCMKTLRRTYSAQTPAKQNHSLASSFLDSNK